MITLQKLREEIRKGKFATPYSKMAIKVTLEHIETDPLDQEQPATSNSLSNVNIIGAFADPTDAIVFLGYNLSDDLVSKLKVGVGLLIRNFSVRNEQIVISRTARVSHMPKLVIPEAIHLKATNLLKPNPAPLATAKNSPVSELVCITGKVIKVRL